MVKRNYPLTNVPEHGDFRASDISKGTGWCSKITCKQQFPHLRAHYRTTHLIKFNWEDVVDSIPENGQVDVYRLITVGGWCYMKGCNRKLSALRSHYIVSHLLKRKKNYPYTIPNEDDTQPLNIHNKEVLIREVLPEGPVDVHNLISTKGWCYRGKCNSQMKNLRKHYILNHLENNDETRGLIPEIPAEGQAEFKVFKSVEGWCDRITCKKFVSSLKLHFKQCHMDHGKKNSTPKMQKISLVRVVDDIMKIDLKKVVSHRGHCKVDGCDKVVRNLNQHLVDVHFYQKAVCPVCKINTGEDDWERHVYGHCHQKFVLKCTTCRKLVRRRCFSRHKLRHSGPKKCSECGEVRDNLFLMRFHIRKAHMGVKDVNAIPADDRDKRDWLCQKAEKRRQGLRCQKGSLHLYAIRQMLDDYEMKLRVNTEYLNAHRYILREKFLELFHVHSDTVAVYNAPFVTLWNITWHIPQLVFEFIEKDDGGPSYSASMFIADPKIPNCTQPTDADYHLSGYCRGHLASARNYRRKAMVAATYYYSNIIPMTISLNLRRARLERDIREMANKIGGVFVAHFQLMENRKDTIANYFRIPSSACTVVMSKHPSGQRIQAWELTNDDGVFDYEANSRDPFELFARAGIQFKLAREDISSMSSNGSSL